MQIPKLEKLQKLGQDVARSGTRNGGRCAVFTYRVISMQELRLGRRRREMSGKHRSVCGVFGGIGGDVSR